MIVPTVEWKEIPSLPGYAVTRDGQVLSKGKRRERLVVRIRMNVWTKRLDLARFSLIKMAERNEVNGWHKMLLL